MTTAVVVPSTILEIGGILVGEEKGVSVIKTDTVTKTILGIKNEIQGKTEIADLEEVVTMIEIMHEVGIEVEALDQKGK